MDPAPVERGADHGRRGRGRGEPAHTVLTFPTRPFASVMLTRDVQNYIYKIEYAGFSVLGKPCMIRLMSTRLQSDVVF